jgi:hypothetical protein
MMMMMMIMMMMILLCWDTCPMAYIIQCRYLTRFVLLKLILNTTLLLISFEFPLKYGFGLHELKLKTYQKNKY